MFIQECNPKRQRLSQPANWCFMLRLGQRRPLRIINRNIGMRIIITAVTQSLAVNLGVLALAGMGKSLSRVAPLLP